MADSRFYRAVVYSILLLTGRSGYAANSINDLNDLMVCRPMTEVFGAIGQGKVERGLLPFFRGPMGPPGPPGRTGSAGEVGEPKDEKILRYLHDEMQKMYAQLFRLEMQLYRTPGFESTNTDEEKSCMEKFNAPIYIGSRCYSLIGGDGLRWNFENAKTNCTDLGGYPADLNDREVYQKLYEYVDHTYSTEIEAWTGMKFENNELLLGDGRPANYSKWISPYPRKTSTSYGSYYKTYVRVAVTIDTSSGTKGIENTRIDKRYDYAVCHFSLNGPLPTTVSPKTTTTDDGGFDSDYDATEYEDSDYYD